ncbi:hypothetical protein [Streptomyces ehimensis]|uniref:Uncharacterized protein n=1 Tax=Streptomyces ehimensis TaxID=68195 RepID=A0ABV9BE62_9ACTN
MANHPEPSSTRPAAHTSAHEQPFLTLHTTVVLLVCLFIGVVVGILTFLSTGLAAGAVLAGLTSTGASIPITRSLIK